MRTHAVTPTQYLPEMKTISFQLPEATVSSFYSYLAAYMEAYGIEADPDSIANAIILSFIFSDQQFREYLEKETTPPSTKTATERTERERLTPLLRKSRQ